jgi:hypothetical protein
MKDVRDHLAMAYGGLSKAGQALFLARMLLRLNLLARGTYSVGDGVEDAAMLRRFNEAQNRIESQLVSLLSSNLDRYPDDVFANIIVDQFEQLGISAAAASNIIQSCRDTAN